MAENLRRAVRTILPEPTRIAAREGLENVGYLSEQMGAGLLSLEDELPGGYRRIYCYHIRKTAGTSLHRAFMALGGEDPVSVEARLARSFLHQTRSGGRIYAAGRRAAQRAVYFYGWSHTPSTELRLRERTFTVTVVRDPIARVRSLYSYLRSGDPSDVAFRMDPAEQWLSEGSFDDFLDRLPPDELQGQLRMFSRTLDVAEAAEGLRRCSFRLRTEHFGEDLKELSSILHLSLEPRNDRVSALKFQLTDREKSRARAMLESEYEMLNQAGLAY